MSVTHAEAALIHLTAFLGAKTDLRKPLNFVPSDGRLALLPVRLRPLAATVPLGLRSRADRSDALQRGDGRARGAEAGMSCREDVRRDNEPQKPLFTAKSAARIISGVMAEAMAAFSTLRWRFTDHCTGSTCSQRARSMSFVLSMKPLLKSEAPPPKE